MIQAVAAYAVTLIVISAPLIYAWKRLHPKCRWSTWWVENACHMVPGKGDHVTDYSGVCHCKPTKQRINGHNVFWHSPL